MVEATGVLAALASEFDVSLEDPGGVTPWPTVTLRPKDEVWARVTTGRESVPSKGLDQPLGSDTEEDG
jgi:hypothetical protein